jgi:PAS domain S-box-containing protein
MATKPTYEELEHRVKELEKESVERSSLEHALRESQQRLELAVDGANLAMWDWNVDTGMVKYSQRWAEILGYFPGEIKPHVSAWEELVHPEDMPQVMQKLNPNLEGLTSFYECEHRLKTKSGDWKWVLARGKVVERNNDGKPLRHTGTQFDINDRVIAQEALKEARNALEQKVAERTVELVNTNELFKQEIKVTTSQMSSGQGI